MPYKDPKDRKQQAKRWRLKNLEKVNATCRRLRRDLRNRNPSEASRRNRAGWLQKVYGISWTTYLAMFKRQRGRCACCGKIISTKSLAKNRATVDHDHSKKKGDPGFIRALLCDLCNKGLGQFKDNLKLLEKAVIYRSMFR